jgi:hypothetical protein
MINRRKLIRAGIAAPFVCKGLWAALEEECRAAISIDGVLPQNYFPDPGSLAAVQGPGGSGTTQMPNPFVMFGTPNTSTMFQSGTAITTKAQWWQHRAELKAMITHYCKGSMPPRSPVVVTQQLADVNVTSTGGTVTRRVWNLASGPDPANRLPFFLVMYIPQNTGTPYGSGPYPTIMTVNGSSSPLQFEPSAGYGSSPGVETLTTLVNTYGYIICEFGKDCICPDEGDLAPSGDDAVYTTAPNGENLLLGTFQQAPKALFQLYPFDRTSGPVPNGGTGIFDLTSASMNYQKGMGDLTGYGWGRDGAWLWAAMRCIDFLFTLSYVDKGKLCTTGVSRNNTFGNWLVALDERITVGLPNQGTWNESSRYQENTGPFNWLQQSLPQMNEIYGPVQGCTVSGCALQPSTGMLHINNTWNPRMCLWWPGRANTGPVPGTKAVSVYGGRQSTTVGGGVPAGSDLTQTVWSSIATVPFDMLTIVALIAPRYMMTTESLLWEVSNCCSVAQTLIAAQTVWTALGLSNRLWARYTDVQSVFNGSLNVGGHEMTQTHWTACVQFCEYCFRGVALPATSTTSGSQSIWCNASTPSATNVNGTTGNSRGFPATSPILGGKGNDGNVGFAWTPPSSLS